MVKSSPVLMILAGNLKRLRKHAGLTQPEFAEKINVASSTVSSWETGKKGPTYELLNNVAEFYGVSVASLFTDQTQVDARALLPPANTPESFFNHLNALVQSEIVIKLDVGDGQIFEHDYRDNIHTGLVSIYINSSEFSRGGRSTKLYDGLHALSKLLFLYKDEPCPRETFDVLARSLHETLSREPPFSRNEEVGDIEDKLPFDEF